MTTYNKYFKKKSLPQMCLLNMVTKIWDKMSLWKNYIITVFLQIQCYCLWPISELNCQSSSQKLFFMLMLFNLIALLLFCIWNSEKFIYSNISVPACFITYKASIKEAWWRRLRSHYYCELARLRLPLGTEWAIHTSLIFLACRVRMNFTES